MNNNTSEVTTSWMRQKYNEFNAKYFNGELPMCSFYTDKSTKKWGNAHVNWACKANPWGYGFNVFGRDYSITMTTAWAFPENIKENVLMHEMIHIADYYFCPDHFVTYTKGSGWKKFRYDAHGERYFMPMARQMKKYGFDIFKCVQKEEEAVSDMNPEIKAKIDRKKAKGYILGYLCYNLDYYNKGLSTWQPKGDGMYFKATINGIDTIIKNLKSEQASREKKCGMGPYRYVVAYLTHAPKYERYSGCRDYVKGWFESEEKWQQMLAEIGDDDLQLIDSYSFEKEIKSVAADTPTEPVQPKTQSIPNNTVHKIPVFRFRTMQGSTFEVRNATREEIKAKLAERFPKWSDEALERALNNSSYYPMGENKISITENDINQMVTEALNMLQDEDDFNAIHGNISMRKEKDGSISCDMA